MTEREESALVRLEHTLARLTMLVERQAEVLRRQREEIAELRAERAALSQELDQRREQGQMAKVAQGFASGGAARSEALGYLDGIIEEVKLCIKQLEQEYI